MRWLTKQAFKLYAAKRKQRLTELARDLKGQYTSLFCDDEHGSDGILQQPGTDAKLLVLCCTAM